MKTLARPGSIRRSMGMCTGLVCSSPSLSFLHSSTSALKANLPPYAPTTAAEDEGRPIHLLKASLPKIRQFVDDKLPAPSAAAAMEVDGAPAPTEGGPGDVEMRSGDIAV